MPYRNLNRMKTTLHYVFFSTFLVMSTGCGEGSSQPAVPDLDAARAVHETAHLTGDAALMVSNFAPVMTSVQRGAVRETTHDESLAMFGAYFGDQDILEWADTEAPDVRYSDDSTMAHVVVVKRVVTRAKTPGPDGSVTPDTTDFAWTELWRVRDGAWQIELTATTRVP